MLPVVQYLLRIAGVGGRRVAGEAHGLEGHVDLGGLFADQDLPEVIGDGIVVEQDAAFRSGSSAGRTIISPHPPQGLHRVALQGGLYDWRGEEVTV